MEIKAKLSFLRIAPRKVRLVTDLVKNMPVKEAEAQLKFNPKRASDPVLKLLNSAASNAKNNFNLEKKDLKIKEIRVDEGPPFKRWRPGSRGMAYAINKRTSHINLILESEKEGVVKKEKPSGPEKIKAESLEEVKDKIKVESDKKEVKKGEKREKPKPKKGFKGVANKIFRRKSF
ncbi:MAG: 50S ribosomal protein L22 [Candidatus Portnoybacteria bacterium]|nr:50S ribosomal protein L22 [Candidatus Portnoybacteria bacterium]